MTYKPLFVINFKTYEHSFGAQGIALARAIEEAGKIKGIIPIICVPATEIRAISQAVKIPVYAQHVDSVEPGAHTGWLSAKMLKDAGATGTLINHSEHRVEDLERAVHLAKQAGLSVIVCARDEMEVRVYRNLPADFLAVEPPELIGGEISVSTAHPEIITRSAKHCPDRLLVGAGVHTHEDVAVAAKLGARGVLLASGVDKATNPTEVCLQLFSGW